MADMRYCPWCGSLLSAREIEGREYLACVSGPCGYVFWDNPKPVVAAIVEHGGCVVLARAKGWPEKMFGLVTGFLERGESPEDGVLREVKEELGVSAAIRGLVGLYPFVQMNQLLIVYHLEASGEIIISDELEEIKLVSPDKLRPWAVGTGPAVKDWLDKRRQGK
ncbi:MAG: NUDIX domain-containing protein [Spirochaetes bacterium]|nr:NUDIX domain-containing protein [Spirochaetota bacterium]